MNACYMVKGAAYEAKPSSISLQLFILAQCNAVLVCNQTK